MKTISSHRIKHRTLIMFFFLAIGVAVIISFVIRTFILISKSRFDGMHQFIVEVKEKSNRNVIIVFNPGQKTITEITFSNLVSQDQVRSLQIPIDASILTNSSSQSITGMLFPKIFSCDFPTCIGINAIDVLKLFTLAKTIRPNAISNQTITFPLSPTDTTTIPGLVTDDILYREGLSVSVVNASGETGLGNDLGKLLSNIGTNVIAISTGNTQKATTISSSIDQTSYTVQRLEQILHIRSQPMQKKGISDIVITIGETHPPL